MDLLGVLVDDPLALARGLQALPLAQWLRHSLWGYPIVSALHIVGIALLLGGIVVLDARLLGYARTVPVSDVARAAWPFAVLGVALALSTGPMLFIVQPEEYLVNPAFRWKLLLLVTALANVALFHLSCRGALAGRRPAAGRVRALAALSIALWLSVLFAGRMIAFV